MKKINTKKGIITEIVLIIVAVAILSYFGLNPLVLWNDYAVPAIRWVWEVVFSVVSFIIEIVMTAIEAFR